MRSYYVNFHNREDQKGYSLLARLVRKNIEFFIKTLFDKFWNGIEFFINNYFSIVQNMMDNIDIMDY